MGMAVMGLSAQDTLRSAVHSAVVQWQLRRDGVGAFSPGMDIRTQGKEGIPVLAAQPGRISRVKVSHLGYGRALYLDSEGKTTVYAHLSAFHPDIERWLRTTPYVAEQWAYDGR